MAEHVKINGSWVQVVSVYKKVNGSWVEQNDFNSCYSSSSIYFYNPAAIDAPPTFVISGVDNYIGKNFNLMSIYNSKIVTGTWSITSGSQYASINTNGKVTIEEGTVNQQITVQATYRGSTATKTITISYDNQLIIEGADTISGTSGNVIARYNSTTVTPTWSVTSGNAYGSIDSTGAITIIDSGTITIEASYNNYTATKQIVLVYDAGSSTETTIDENGNVTTETTTTTTDPETGATTTTTTTTTTNDDGSSSSTETAVVENEDGSTSTSTTTTNSDGSSTQTESTTSAPDPETGAVTTETSSATTNADGSTSETNGTVVENEDGSSQSSSTTVNYDENGDTTGSSANQTTNNADGSSASSTTNYDASGDPTSATNNTVDTSGNSNTQDIEYEDGDPVVTGYTIDTTGNTEGTGEEIEGNGVNTEFVPFNFATQGFVLHIRFKTIAGDQPRPPIVADTEDSGSNYLYTILGAKATHSEDGKIWPGFEIRWVIAKSGNGTSGQLQFCRTLSGETSTTRTQFQNNHDGNNVYDITITYNPTLNNTNRFLVRNNITNSNIQAVNKSLQSGLDIELTLGYSTDQYGVEIRHSNVTIYEFSVSKLTT